MLVDFNLFIMLCHFFNDANASMISTINSFKSKEKRRKEEIKKEKKERKREIKKEEKITNEDKEKQEYREKKK